VMALVVLLSMVVRVLPAVHIWAELRDAARPREVSVWAKQRGQSEWAGPHRTHGRKYGRGGCER
jgi:hypothetical protein